MKSRRRVNSTVRQLSFLGRPHLAMAKQPISKYLSVAALGLLVSVFGLVLLVVAAPLFAPRTPGVGGFVFSISRRAFTSAVVTFLTVLASALFSLLALCDGDIYTETLSNKSLDASGGSVFRIMTGPAMVE